MRNFAKNFLDSYEGPVWLDATLAIWTVTVFGIICLSLRSFAS